MADPKIRFDILANAQGAGEVSQLANELEKLDGSLDPALAARAKETATQLREVGRQQEAIATFKQLKTASTDTAAALNQAQAQAQALAREIAAAGTPTRTQAGQMEKLRDAVRSAKDEHTKSVQKLQEHRQAMTDAGVSTSNLAAQQAALGSRQSALRGEVTRIGDAYRAQGAAATASAGVQQRAHETVRNSVESIGQQLRSLQSIAAAALGGQLLGGLAGDVAKTADAYSNLSARIKLVTGDTGDFERSLNGVFEVATRTNSNVEQTADLFTRLARAGREIGLGNEAALALTETINQAVQVSGGSAESSSAAITQLIQGLQSGVLRGEEFNSVMEQAPRLAQALADGLGMTTGKLREQAQAGALTSQVVIEALQGQSRVVQEEFSQMPATVGRAIQNLSTEWTRYVGEVDQANGISQKAAEAIGYLAEHLDDLAGMLFSVGKAALAYKAIQLAQEFMAVRAAATAAAAGVVALDTAQRAAAVSGAGAAAGAGRLVAMLGSIKLMALVAVVANLKEIGTWIGESAAKLMGWGRVMEENERKLKAQEDAARTAAQAHAELAQKAKLAQEASVGLNDVSRKIVADFQDLTKKGGETSAAIDKLAKSLNLEDLKGIDNAGAALDQLRIKGELTATQVREVWAKALNGQNLTDFADRARQIFETFDGSAQGANRLKVALDAVADESLRRVGTSLGEVKTGFNDTIKNALSDVDQLGKTLEGVGVKGEQASKLLGDSLNKALDAAKTEQAIKAVIERMEQLGKSGMLTGDQLVTGLQKARNKLDDLKPGINSLEEAMRKLGITSDASLKKTADEAKEAYDTIKTAGTASAREVGEAFKKAAEAAIAANGGVAPSWVQSAAAVNGYKVVVDAAGKATLQLADALKETKDGHNNAANAANTHKTALEALNDAKEREIAALERANALKEREAELERKRLGIDKDGFSVNSKGERITLESETRESLFQKAMDAGLTAKQADRISKQFIDERGQASGYASYAQQAGESWSVIVQREIMKLANANQLQAADAGTATSRAVNVNVNLGGFKSTIATASQSDADALTNMLKRLETDMARSI